MHLVTSVLLVGVIVAAVDLSSARRYFVDEEKRNDERVYAWIPDDEGQPHLVNLHQRGANVPVNPEDIQIYVYDSYDGSKVEIKTVGFDGNVPTKGFDPERKTIFITHGWTGTHNSKSCRVGHREFLAENRTNVFVVDWGKHAHEFYTVARAAVPEIGAVVGGFIDTMLANYKMEASNVMLIGNSLGAHVVGAIGASMAKKPGYIVGLDPAQPLFYVDEPENRLDIEDGELVHIVHTNGGFLGFRSSIGHADYFANGGGMTQPGCGDDIFGTCAHGRSIDYYAESIRTSTFEALQCDSFKDFQEGFCAGNQVSLFGTTDLDTSAQGDFYFNTNSESPFALN